MAKILAIALNTFKEAVRNRVLYIILIFALAMLGATGIISDLTIADEERIIRDMGLASIRFFGLLIAVFVGIGLVYHEMDKKTIYTIISKPIDRHQFILGKFFGLLMTIYVIVIFMGLFFLFVLHLQSFTKHDVMEKVLWNHDGTQWVRVSFGTYILYLVKSFFLSILRAVGSLLFIYQSPVTANIVPVIFYTCIELAILTAFAILFSTITSPTLSAILTVLTFVIGRLNEDIIRYAWRLAKKPDVMATMAGKIKYGFSYGAAHIAPNFELFNKRFEAVYGTVGFDLLAILYGIVYTAFIITLAVIVFKHRNIK
jgi:ABC-type transport system involved in multi-copper enzyme maturation permease subunit